MRISRAPKKMRRFTSSHDVNVQGWWYENAGSIDVFLRDADAKRTMSGRIRRADLVAWLKRTAARP